MYGGYFCMNCGVWVPYNTIHSCSNGYGYGYASPYCDHCYCIPLFGEGGTNPHKKCCKCGEVMSELPISINPNLEDTTLIYDSSGKMEWISVKDLYKTKKLSYVVALMYFPNCRTCDAGFYTGLKFFNSLKDLLNFAKDEWYDYELTEIHITSSGKSIGRITYKTGYHSLEYLEFKAKYLTLRTKDDGKGNLVWYRV